MSYGGDLLSISSIDEQVEKKLNGEKVYGGLANRCISDAEEWVKKGAKIQAWYEQVKRVLG